MELVMQLSMLPTWLEAFGEEDLQFLRCFLVTSGSLKAVAEQYGVSYPTVRGRLDRLIAKVEAAEGPAPHDLFERKLTALVADGKLTTAIARDLLESYRTMNNGEGR